MRVTIEEASCRLRQGEVVAMPTETVYGLAASIDHPKAIQHVFSLKNRPLDNPLIVHVSNLFQVLEIADIAGEEIAILTERFWPGALTLVLPVKDGALSPMITAGLSTAAFRLPQQQETQAVIASVGPVVMPSANRSGYPSATEIKHVHADFGKEFPVLEGAGCGYGLESTIVKKEEDTWVILRLGAISAEQLAEVLGETPHFVKKDQKGAPICPGTLYRHYAPEARLLLDPDTDLATVEVVVGFCDRTYPSHCRLFSLGNSNDPEGVARELYRTLRALDSTGVSVAWVDLSFPEEGLWVTIAERLQKASA